MSSTFVPQPRPADERMGIVAETGAVWERSELLGVASTQHDAIGYKGGFQTSHDIIDRVAPLLLAESLKSATPDIVLKGSTFLLGQMCEFHLHNDVVCDERGAEPYSQSEKEQPAQHPWTESGSC